MKVKDVMITEVEVCDLNSSLAQAAKAMWDSDCGILPVLKDGREIVGLITDRDICMATATKDRNAASISVQEVITGNVYSITPEDDVHEALETMQQHRVRRLPVVDAEGNLKGILSMNDIVLKAKEGNGKTVPKLTYADVIETYKAICEHPQPMTKAATTASQ
jgi:CBS domain-containing protein